MNQTRFNCLVVNCRDDHQSDYSLVTLVEHLSYHMHSRGFTEHFEYQCLDCDAYFFNKVFMVRHKMQPEFQQHKIIHIPCKDLQNPTSDIKLATVVNELTDDLLRYRYKVSQSRSNGVSYAHKMMLTPRTPTRSATSGYTPRTPAMVHSSNSPPRTPRYGPGGDFSNSFANASLPTKTATYCRTPPRAVRYANLDDAGTDSSQPHHRRMQEALGISGCRDRPRFERSSHDNPSYRPRGGNDDGPRTRGGRGNRGYRGGRGGFDRSDDGNSRGGSGSFRGRGRGYRGRTDASMRPNDRSRSRSPMKKRKASPGRRSYSRSRSNTPDNSHSHNRIPPQKKPSRERRSYSRSPRSD